MKRNARITAIAGMGLLLLACPFLLAESPPVNGVDPAMRPMYRSSKVVGMTVKNTAGETVGTINDLVVDAKMGKLRYAVLSVGGFLGVGNRLFAIPWTSFALKHEDSSSYFVLDVDKEKLKNAPGFDKDNWPDMADPRFGIDIDHYFGADQSEKVPAAAR